MKVLFAIILSIISLKLINVIHWPWWLIGSSIFVGMVIFCIILMVQEEIE